MDVRDGVREEFEVWAAKSGLSLTRANQAMCFANGRRVAVDDYIIGETQIAYLAWRANNASAYGDGYRAGFRAASGEVEQ